MKKLFTFLFTAILACSVAWAETYSWYVNSSKAQVQTPENSTFFTQTGNFTAQGDYSWTYDGITSSMGWKMASDSKLEFTATKDFTLIIVQSIARTDELASKNNPQLTYPDNTTVKLSEQQTALSIDYNTDEIKARVWTLSDLEKGTYSITRQSQFGLGAVYVVYSDVTETSRVTTISSVLVNGQDLIEANLNALTGEGHSISLYGQYDETPVVVFNATSTITYSNNKTSTEEISVNASVSAVEGTNNYIATATVDGVDYTINLNYDHEYIVYYGNTKYNWNEVWAYVWNGDNSNAAYPGVRISGPNTNGEWYYTFTESELGFVPTNIIFSDGTKTDGAEHKTADLEFADNMHVGLTYASWWIKVNRDNGSEWVTEQALPIDGIATFTYPEGLYNGNFGIKVWHDGYSEDVWHGKLDKDITIGEWITLNGDNQGNGLALPDLANGNYTVIQYDCFNNKVKVDVLAAIVKTFNGSVEIRGTQEGNLKYSLDGETFMDYVRPFTLSESATVYAKLCDGNLESKVTSAEVYPILRPEDTQVSVIAYNNCVYTKYVENESPSILTGKATEMSKGYILSLTGNWKKEYQSGSSQDLTIDDVVYTPIKVSNGAQNTLTLPEGYKAKRLTIYSIMNYNQQSKPGRTSYWSEIAGTTYTEENSILLGAWGECADQKSNPDVRVFELNDETEVTFTQTGEQLLFVAVIDVEVPNITVGFNNEERQWMTPHVKYSVDADKSYIEIPMRRYVKPGVQTFAKGSESNNWIMEIPANTTHMTFTDGNGTDIGKTYSGDDIKDNRLFDGVNDDPTTGVEAVAVEAVNGEAVYYNLQGVRVANPANGIYIEVRGNKTSKVIL